MRFGRKRRRSRLDWERNERLKWGYWQLTFDALHVADDAVALLIRAGELEAAHEIHRRASEVRGERQRLRATN